MEQEIEVFIERPVVGVSLMVELGSFKVTTNMVCRSLNGRLTVRVELLISDQNRAVVCLRKRKQDDVSTSVLSVEVNEALVNSLLWPRARLF